MQNELKIAKSSGSSTRAQLQKELVKQDVGSTSSLLTSTYNSDLQSLQNQRIPSNMSEVASPSEFMITYITRFKVQYEAEIANLEQCPLAQPAFQMIQMGRARRVVDAANVILAMGPNAVHQNQEKFEAQRAIIFNNNAAFRTTQRQIRNTPPRSPPVVNHAQLSKMRLDRHR